MKKYLSLFVVSVMAFAIGGSVALAEDTASLNSDVRVCAMDAKMCPDGSYVGRSGPNCEFKACPNSTTGAETKVKVDFNKESEAVQTNAQTSAQVNARVSMDEMQKQNEAMRAEEKVKIDALRANIKLEKDTVKAKIEEARITGREKALERFDAAVQRMTNLKARINAQIMKLEAKGVDVTNAKSLVATADVKLSAANAKIVQINAVLAVSINQLTPANKTALRTLAKDTQALISDAHKALNDSIKALRDAMKIKMDADANASATTSTTGNPQ